MKSYGKKRTYGKRRNYRRRKAPVRKTNARIARVVKRILHRNIENKSLILYAANQSIPTASTSQAPFILTMIPSPTQGTGVANRIGNEINIRRAVINGRVNILPYNSVTNYQPIPVLVKFFLCSYKINNQPNTASISTYDTFFDVGNTGANFQGNTLDLVLSPDKEVWTVHKTKTLRLGVMGTTGTGPAFNNANYYDASVMTMPFSFSAAKILGKLKYDDTVNNLCTNKNLWLIIQAVPADGSTGSALRSIECHYNIRFDYEDA